MSRVVRPKKTLEPWQSSDQEPYIVLENISKSYDNVPVLKDVSLSIYKEEFFSLLGPSGCGKTTLLRILAGLEFPDKGRILIDGVDVTNIPPDKRPVNMMFQSYALFPHMTVGENVAFGLRQEKCSEKNIQKRVQALLKLVHMENFKDRKPQQLSGGQRQRVALARSLAKRPKLLLLDEPLAALDKQLRESTQFELVNIQESVGVTFILVTHDQEEAMTMSTRLSIMEEGHIRQIGTPSEIYEFPNSHYVANFIGIMNMFEGIISEEASDHVRVRCDDLDQEIYVTHAAGAPIGAQASIAIRPEKVGLSTKPLKSEYNCIKGIVTDIGYLGDVSMYHVKIPSGKIIQAMLPNLMRLDQQDITWDDQVYLYWKPENAILLLA